MPRRKKQNGQGGDPSPINLRIREIARQHSLSTIARKTGTPNASVHRYLNGGRVPGDFCARLADAFAINPSWLLNGRGRPLLVDVAPDTTDMAGNLLELIEAMSAVEQMQLGALTGKHHLRVLRELSDAMARYEDLRARLHKMGTPVLKSVLRDLTAALDRRDIDRAEELSGTAAQLGRFCDDAALALEAAVLQGRLATLGGNLALGLEATRKVATLALHRPEMVGELELAALAETARSLSSMSRLKEARRIAEAALKLAPDNLRHSSACFQLEFEVGSVQVHTGELEQGLARLVRVEGRITGAVKPLASATLIRALLYAGVLDVNAALAFGEDSNEKAWFILGFALFTESEADLSAASAYAARVLPPESRPGADWQPQWPETLTLRVLRGEKAGVLKGIRKIEQAERRGAQMPLDWRPIFTAQAFRLMRRTEDARRRYRAACRALKAVPPEFTTAVMWRARHLRNALELGSNKEQKHAREWFQTHVERGYHCFTHLT